jgi:hypothetical protein
MFFATFLSLFIVPILYVVIKSLIDRHPPQNDEPVETHIAIEELERLVQAEEIPSLTDSRKTKL